MNTSRLVGPFNAISSEESRFSLGFLSRGGGANAIIPELRGAQRL